jgi:hypothetical protein
MALPALDRETVLQIVRHWPQSEQLALAHAILADAHKAALLQPPAVPSTTLRGILSTGQPAPSDEEVERILDEERAKKYGL